MTKKKLNQLFNSNSCRIHFYSFKENWNYIICQNDQQKVNLTKFKICQITDNSIFAIIFI